MLNDINDDHRLTIVKKLAIIVRAFPMFLNEAKARFRTKRSYSRLCFEKTQICATAMQTLLCIFEPHSRL